MENIVEGTAPNQAAALEYQAVGLSPVPLSEAGKWPAVRWKPYQTRQPTRDELISWSWDHGVMVVTGAISGIAVLDADSEEANAEIQQRGMPAETPRFKTKNGYQYVLKHPGEHVKTCSGILFPALDVRGDGGVTAFPPSPNKVWEVPLPDNLDELPTFPAWALEGLRANKKAKGAGVDLAALLNGVDEGQRDQSLFLGLCKLRGAGVPKWAAYIVGREAALNANPPFDPAAAVKKVDEVYARYPEGDGGEKPTEDVLRNRWLNAFPNYAHGQGEWKTYEAGAWYPVEDDEILAGVLDILEAAKPEGVKPKASLGKSVAEIARVKARVSRDKWDSDTEILVCQNGTLHIPTRELRPHSPEHYATSAVPYSYSPERHATAWERYVQTTFTYDVGRFLQEFAGYALTTDTRYELAIWLAGERGSGKSTYLEGLGAMLGARMGKLGLRAMDQSRFGLAGIKGKTLLVATETPGGWFRSTHDLNAIISGEPVTIERKHRDAFEIKPTAKIAWAMNSVPRIADPEDGIFRRVKIVEFEPRPEDEREPGLKEAIQLEGAGILNWALEGLDRLRERGGFDIPVSVEEASSEFQESNDVAAAFVAEVCETGDSFKVSGAQLYNAYAYYCRSSGHKPKSKQHVAADWKRLGFERRRVKGATQWLGVYAEDPDEVRVG